VSAGLAYSLKSARPPLSVMNSAAAAAIPACAAIISDMPLAYLFLPLTCRTLNTQYLLSLYIIDIVFMVHIAQKLENNNIIIIVNKITRKS